MGYLSRDLIKVNREFVRQKGEKLPMQRRSSVMPYQLSRFGGKPVWVLLKDWGGKVIKAKAT